MTLPLLQAYLADRYALDTELRAAIAEQGRTPHLLERQRVTRAEIVQLRAQIEQAAGGWPVMRVTGRWAA